MSFLDKKLHQQYLAFNKEFYESASKYHPTSEQIKLIYKDIPLNYVYNYENLWFYLQPQHLDLPLQGWKIHISAITENKSEILKTVAKICFSKNLSFKFLADEIDFRILANKMINRGSSNKFITIYPINEKEFKDVIEILYEKLKDYNGPYILSDLRYKDCKVLYYRYGGIRKYEVLTFMGEKDLRIIDPNGNEIEDRRVAYWNPPYWIKDPFQIDETSNV